MSEKIAVISMVKNEADIIESFVRYYATFADYIIIADHNSDDGTWEILEKLRDRLVPFLIEYRKLFRSKVEIGVFFRKSTSLNADDRKKENRIIYDKEKKYLGTIRRFVQDEFKKQWNDFLDKEYQEEAYKSKSYEWQQEAASKYDMYPNLME